MTQNNLGVALATIGERGMARLEEAVVAYRDALMERTRERVPLDWALTQDNLGAALLRLGERESGTARLEEAVAAYRDIVAREVPELPRPLRNWGAPWLVREILAAREQRPNRFADSVKGVAASARTQAAFGRTRSRVRRTPRPRHRSPPPHRTCSPPRRKRMEGTLCPPPRPATWRAPRAFAAAWWRRSRPMSSLLAPSRV
jgi:hypothetical protein